MSSVLDDSVLDDSVLDEPVQTEIGPDSETSTASEPTAQGVDLSVIQSDHHHHAAHGDAHHDHHSYRASREEWNAWRAEMMRNGLDWVVVTWLGLIHIGTVAALFFFSWPALVACVVLHWLTGGIGVCLGYHRMLTHGSFKAPNWLRNTLATIGGLSGEGSALHWVANHRKHHAHSDQIGDPHSPLDGAWWSHIIWTTAYRTPEENKALHSRWIPDLKDDKGLILLDKHFLTSHFLLGVLMGGIGYLIDGWYGATSMVLWGMFARLAFVMHSTWFVNSASHMWGYRNYETSDDSRNNWWVALITYGEGWHNNHHAYPRMARHGHRWWEVDMTFMAIRLMERLGLVWDVVDHQHHKRDEEHTVRTPAEGSQEAGVKPMAAGQAGPQFDTEAILKAHAQQLQQKKERETVG